MAGATLSELADVLAGTGSAYVTGPEKLINDARQRAPALARWMDGKDMKMMLSGGADIKFNTMLDAQETAAWHLAGADQSFSNPQVIDTGTYDWRFLSDHETYIDQEMVLNGPSDMDGPGRFQRYQNLREEKEQRCLTSMYGALSRALWAEPDALTMVGKATTAAVRPNSIAVFLNEYANGLYNSAGSAGTAWTTVGNIDPTASGNSNWTHPRITYTSGSTAQPKGGGATAGAKQNDVIAAFGKMFRRLQYVPYNKFDEYMTANPMDRSFIACSEYGITHFEESCRDRQDAFINASDPAYPHVNFRGIPLVYQQELDTATLYPNHLTLSSATDNVAEGTANSTSNAWGPRYYWLTPRYLTPVFHEDRFFHKHKPIYSSTTAERVVLQRTCYVNFICTSRLRNGLVSPGAASLFTAY